MLSQPLIKVRQSQTNDQKCKTYDFAWSCNFTSFSSTAARSLSKPWENLNVDNIKRWLVAWLTCNFMWYVYFYALILVLTFVKAIWDNYDFGFILFSLEHFTFLAMQDARFSAHGKIWDESGRDFLGSGTHYQSQTPCRPLTGNALPFT